MTITKHELQQGRLAWLIWTAAVAVFIAICLSLFPEIKKQMAQANELFASMGSFTAAFGMDRLNIGTLKGFYAVECAAILGLGGGCYAALMGVLALVKEEKDGTAEFLLTHPVERTRILREKLLALFIQITAMNLAVFLLALACVAAIGENIPWKELSLLHLALYLLQLELGAICFGCSAFLRRGGAGVGLFIAIGLYFLNVIANISKSARFLRYLTPYAYAEGADILANGSLDWRLVLVGLLYGALAILLAFSCYTRKDIR